MPKSTINIKKLNEGDEGIVKNISGGNSLRLRLMELGFVAETLIRCVSINSFCDSITVRVRGAAFSIRNSDAENIIIYKINT